MKKIILIVVFALGVLVSFSQETKKVLTEQEKEELRKNKTELVFSNNKKNANTKTYELNTSNTNEESDGNVKVTTKVKYYYGKQDSLYKSFEYTKRD